MTRSEWVDKCKYLDKIHKNNVHYNSIYSFLLYFDNITNKKSQEIVSDILKSYFEIIEANDFIISIKESRLLYQNHIFLVGNIYREELNFKMRFSYYTATFLGGIFDILLAISGISKLYYFAPICFFILVGLSRIQLIRYNISPKLFGVRF